MGGTPPNEARSDNSPPQYHQLKQSVKTWSKTSISRILTDSRGIYCIKIDTPKGEIYAITKQYIHQENASFPNRILKRATDHNKPVSIFFGEPPRMGKSYVYNAQYVINHGNQNKSNSNKPKHKQKTWVDIPIKDGVIFGDYITNREELKQTEKKPHDRSDQTTLTE